MNHASKSTNPFPGLRAFRQDEDYLFFGREEQTIELLRRLGGNRFVTVVGTSGSGKSSLVRCGLLSELLGGRMLQAGAAWEVAVTHPGGNPLAILTDSLLEADLYDREVENARENLLATLSRSHFGLVEAVRQSGIGGDTNFLLVVDQFEEIFRFREAGQTQQEAAAEFVSLLLQAVAQREVPVYVVLTMRSDFIGECSQFEGLSEMVNQGEFLIPRLTREQYKRVIEGPVKVAGGKIAPRLLQRLLNDLGQQADQLPCLQHALMRTWEVWAEAGETGALDLDDYRRVGGMAEALSLHADEVYGALGSDKEREWCRGLFEALTVKESENRGIRRPQRLSSLCEILEVPFDQLVPVIDAFRRQGVTFLMPSPEVDLTDSTIIDISHESLMRVWTRLRHWVEEEAQAAGIYVRLAESAMLHAEGKAGLYRDPELGIALSWIDRARHPNQAWAERYRHGFPEAMSFLAASKEAAEAGEREKEAARQREVAQANALAEAERLRAEEHDKGARRLRKLLAAAAVIALIAIGASIFAALQTGKARKSEAAADALASQLKTSLVQGDFNNSFEKLKSGDAAASLAYLARATRTNPAFAPASMRALSTLSSGRLPVQRFAPIEHRKPISDYLHNKKHDVLLTSSDGGREVHLWNMETGLMQNPLEGTSVERPRNTDAGPAPAAVLAGIKKQLAGARKVWLAADPTEPPPQPRYFRKSIAIPADRKPVRGDLFLIVDDAFSLSVNGVPAGGGNNHEVTYHFGLAGPALGSSLDLSIVASSRVGGAGVIALIIIAFEDGEPLVVTSDRSWQSSTQNNAGFTDSKEWDPYETSLTEELSAPALTELHWSVDEDRIIGWEPYEGQISSWDVGSGKRTAISVKAAGIKDLRISAYDEPGDLVGCSYGDGAIQVWNLKTGEAATPRLKTGGNVTQWSFTPDGKRVIGLFSDALIVAWDVSGGAEVARISTRPIRPAGILVSHDGRYVLTWDETMKQVAWWEVGASGGAGELTWVELPFVAGDMRFLASGDVVSFIGSGNNGTMRARSFALTGDRRQVADITSNPNAIRMGHMGDRSHGSSGIAGALTANAVTLWDLRTGEAFPHPLIAPELLSSANLSPDGRRLIAGSATVGAAAAAAAADKKLFVFNVFSGGLVFPRPIILQSSSQITFSPDSETLVTMDPAAKRTGFWDLRTGREVRAPVPVDASSVIFSRSGKRVALYQFNSVSRGTKDLGQTTGRFFLHEIGLSPAAPEYMAERSSRYSFVSAPLEGGRWLTYDWPSVAPAPRLQVWDAQRSAAERTIQLDVGPKIGNSVASVEWSGNGQRMIYINDEKSAAVLETFTGKILAELKCDARVYVVAMSRDGSTAACGTADGTVTTWAEDGTKASFNPFAVKDGIRYLAINASGSLLAVADDTKRTVGIVDPRTGAPRFEPRHTVNISEDFTFTPDGRHVIVSQLDSKIPMIDLKSGEVVREFEIADWSRGIDLSADGHILAVGSGANLSAPSGMAYLFDVESGKMLTPPLPHGGSVREVRLSSDGAILATGTFQTAAGFAWFQLWDVAAGLPLTDPVGERGQVISIAIQPDGSAAAVGWSNGVVQTIAIPPRTLAPAWFPEIAEAVAGRRLAAETGTLENVPDEELAATRKKVLAADSVYSTDADWFKWVKWLFEDPETRTVSPGAKTTVARHVERLRAADNIDDLHQAVRLSPNDALTFSRLAALYLAQPADIGTAKRHWEDTVVWFSDRAIELAPENPEVWTMRGELMRKLSRAGLATEAAAKVLALAPTATSTSSPNTLYQKALALASQGKWEEAQTAYDGAIDLLDAYVKQLEAGGQPLPLLGNLGRLVPTRVAAAKPDQAGDAARVAPGISKDPIPGAFESFDAVSPGALPPGWRVWNRSDPGSRPGVHHAADFQTDAWKDWTVIDRKQLDWGDDYLRKRVLMEEAERQKLVAGGTTPLLDGRFALAMSSSRPGEQIQYLESPDFDCSGRKDVHLAFNSAWEQDDLRMGMLEYSLDRGKTWKPVVYFVHKPLLDEAKKKYADARKDGGAKDEFDVAAFLNEERGRFPWRLDPGVAAHRGRMGAFTVAAVTPGLAACIEGRNKGMTEYKRREIRPLPDADGAATVRLRFGAASPSHAFWAIDDVGLYEGDKAAIPVAVGAGAGAGAEKELKRPANDPEALLKLVIEFVGGRKAAEDEAPNTAPLMAAAMATFTSDNTDKAPKATPGSGTASPTVSPGSGRFMESRLLVTRARKLAPANRQLRVFASMMELAGLEAIATDRETVLREADPFFGRAHELLVKSSDPAADLRDPVWREGYCMIVAARGMLTALKGERESGMTLLAVAESIAQGPAVAMIQQMIASPGGKDPAAIVTDAGVLLRRGSAWSYFDEGKLPDPAWMQPEFEDRLWFRGPASLGYGDNPKTAVGWGPDANKRFITTYFRTRFDVADPGKIRALVLRLQRDDGAVVYLNGAEVWRDNMPKGAIDNETLAVDTVNDKDEQRFFDHTLEGVSLKKGANVVAVEVHQNQAKSSDLSFDLEIAGISAPKAVTGSAIPVATLAEKLKTFGIPELIQAEFWSFRVEQFIKSGDSAKTAEAFTQAEVSGARDESDPRMLRLRALIAAAGAKDEEAGRLYDAAMDGMLEQAAAGKTIDAAKFPAALREAGLVLQQTPADLAFILRRFASPTRTELELNLALRWAKAKAGNDPRALAQIWLALSDNLNREEDALTIAESILASLPKPKGGAAASEIRQYKEWLERKEKGLRALGNKAAADALRSEIRAVPPRDRGLNPKLLDLTDYYNGDLFRSSELFHITLAFVPLKGVSFDVRGYLQLESGPLPDGKTFNEKYNGKHPLEQKGIKVGQKSPAIHFLTSTSWGRETRGVEVARFVMHYDDGSEATMSVKFLDDVADQIPYQNDFVDAGKVGWRGFNEGGTLHEISELIWKNPHPDKTIKSFDFISAKAKAAPFLLGLTLE